MADQTLATKYYEQLQAAQAMIFKLECQLANKQCEPHSRARVDQDGETIAELERQAIALSGQNQKFVNQIGALKQEAGLVQGRLHEAERELRVLRNQAQAKEKEMAAQIVKLMEEAATQHGLSVGLASGRRERDLPNPVAAGAGSETTCHSTVEDEYAGDIVMNDSPTTRPARSSAQRTRERFIWEGHESDDSEDLPIKAEHSAASKSGAIAGQKRKHPGSESEYSTSLGKMQIMSLHSGGPAQPKKQAKLNMPQAKKRGRPPGSTNKAAAARLSGSKSTSVRPSLPKAKKPSLGSPVDPDSKHAARHSLNEIQDFNFKLIMNYTNATKSKFGGYTSDDLVNEMSDFWDILRPIVDTWENRAGAEWSFDIERATKTKKCRVCVNSKLDKRSTVWREGDQGFFACKDCVSRGKPCFTWAGEDEGYHCLPVHEADRRKPVIEGKEIWYWVNEGDQSDDEGPKLGRVGSAGW